MTENFSRKKISLRTRQEELDEDVSDRYIFPPFYNHLDILNQRKPRVIVGGRGAGKTTLLRHFSHASMFSRSRTSIAKNEIQHIGLYKKFDIQFCKMMFGRSIADDDWENAFSHYISLSFGQEILKSLESIAWSNAGVLTLNDLQKVSFKSLKALDSNIPNSYSEFKSFLLEKSLAFESWVSNVRRDAVPRFLPYNFLERVIEALKLQLPEIIDSVFYIYIDEFENLRDSQKRIINTYLKHSSGSLIFNYAMKRVANPFRETTGDEQINEPDDYKIIDLDSLLRANEGENFKIFGTEILFAEIQSQKLGNFGLDLDALKNPEKIPERLSKGYQDKLLSKVNSLFPELTHASLASKTLDDRVLYNKLLENIQEALKNKNSNLNANLFVDMSFPRESIIMPALLNRDRTNAEEILEELRCHKLGHETSFRNLLHNNFVASYLQLFHATQKTECPLYTGFDTFCRLSHDNIRHLLVLCETSLQCADNQNSLDNVVISPEDQSRAARLVSSKMLGEVKGFGSFGLKLHQFVTRIGYMFGLDNLRSTLSENERNHFAIISEKETTLSESSLNLLNEAEKWSVLFKRPVTKKKREESPDLFEYQLNPIFAPYFLISHRRKRRMELDARTVEILFNGKLEEYSSLIKNFKGGLLSKGQEQSMVPTLFDDVDNLTRNAK